MTEEAILNSLRKLGGSARIRTVREFSEIPWEVFRKSIESLVRSGKIAYCEEFFDCIDIPGLKLFDFCESFFDAENDRIYLSIKLVPTIRIKA